MMLLTSYCILDGLLILSGAFAGIYFYLVRNFNYWKKRGIKQVSPSVPFGNFGPIILARKAIIYHFQDIYQAGENEPYIGFYILDNPGLLIRDPELIKQICIKDFNNFSVRNQHSSYFDSLRNSLFAIANPDWHYLRKKLSPIFSYVKLKQMFPQMLEIGEDLHLYIKELNIEEESRVLAVRDICAKFTIDVIGITAYGLRFNCLRDPNTAIETITEKVFQKTYARHIEFLSAFFIKKFVNLFNFYLFGKDSGKFLNDIFLKAMSHRKQSAEQFRSSDVIGTLLNMQNDLEQSRHKYGLKITNNDMTSQAAIFFAGGFKSSALTMSYTLYELAKNPKCQQKVRDEMREALKKNNGKITYEMVLLNYHICRR